MDLFSGTAHDHDHQLDGNGAYEWWYVDALSPDGEWGVVVILFRGMPMSPAYLDDIDLGKGAPLDHCGYAVSVYHRTKRVAFAFREIPASDLHVPDHVFDVDTTLVDVPTSIRVRVEIQGTALTDSGSSTSDHGWVLVAPRVKARVELALAENGITMAAASWKGLAYRDHNFGPRPLHADFKDWLWGRVHAEDRTFVYLATPQAATPFQFCGEIREGATELLPWTDLRIETDHHRPTIMGLVAPRRVTVVGTDPNGHQARLICQNRYVVEDGPFYQRYLSEWSLDGIPVGRGTSEYMNAARLGDRWIRPFLRLPFFRHG